MIRRWQAVIGLIVFTIGTIAPSAFAQDDLGGIPAGPLHDQVVWFVELLNSGAQGTSEDEIAAHFSPDFLQSVPADQVVATVAQLLPMLGPVTVGRIARGTTKTDAGVQLIGETGIRLRATIWVEPETGLIGGLLIEPDTSEPEATAVTSPAASPVAVAVPPQVQDVLPAYEAAEQELIESGREVIALFREGDDAGVRALVTTAVADAFGETTVSDSMRQLQTSRVHFEFAEAGVIFDGHFSPGAITGFFYQGGPGYFQLTPNETQTGEVPTGRWMGQILVGATGLDIEIEFSGEADMLSATLDIPQQKITGQPLSNVRFRADEPLGELLSERALPLGAATGANLYTAAYAWADGMLTINAGFNQDGQAASLQTAAYWPLPPDPAEVATVPYRLPFEGTWFVIWGGDTELENYHASTPNQRHAYDIVIWKDGATYSGDGTDNEQYYAWGQQVLSPADGTVVGVLNNLKDLRPNQLADPDHAQQVDPMTHPAGNHVVIQTAENEFVLIAHMQEGSVRVQPGDTVATGEVLGLVGNSGHTSEPHIHIHVQSTADFFAPDAIGLPLQFTDFLANGEPHALGVPVQGEFISPAD